MCHFEAPAGASTAGVVREEVRVPVVGGEEMPALLARPERGTGAPVLVVHDIFGRSPFYEELAARLAAEGFTALLPDFFCRHEALPERNIELAYARRRTLNERRTLRELNGALDWLAARTGTRGRRLGTIGFCLGGTLVLGLAAARDDLASVCYYGFPAPGPHDTDLSLPPPLTLVDRMRGPILGFWGDQDAGVGMHNVAALQRALRERGVAYEQVIYPGVGHGFLAAQPSDAPAYQAAQDSWARTLAFYREQVVGSPQPHNPDPAGEVLGSRGSGARWPRGWQGGHGAGAGAQCRRQDGQDGHAPGQRGRERSSPSGPPAASSRPNSPAVS